MVGGGKRFDDLGGGIARNEVVPDNIVAGTVEEQDPIGVPTEIVVLDLVSGAGPLEPDTKIDIPTRVVDAAISVEGAVSDRVVVAVGETNAAARRSIGRSGVIRPHVFFEATVRGG